MFARESRHFFTQRVYYSNHGILNRNLGLYLYYRTKTLLNAHKELPDKIRQVTEFVAESLNLSKPDQQEAILRSICDDIGEVCTDYAITSALCCMGDNSYVFKRADKDFSIQDKVAPAVFVDSLELLQKLAPQRLGADSSLLFGSPLHNSASLGHTKNGGVSTTEQIWRCSDCNSDTQRISE